MLNRIVLMGRLTRDPELRRTQSGTAVVSFSIACDRDYAAQGAERETDFIDIVAWRGTAEFVEKYFSKGRMIVVGGRLQIRNWQDKEATSAARPRFLPTAFTLAILSATVTAANPRASRPTTRPAASRSSRTMTANCRSKGALKTWMLD